MRELSDEEVFSIHGGKNVFSKIINVAAGALVTGLIEGFAGLAVAGPAGFAVGFGHGAFEGSEVKCLKASKIYITPVLTRMYKSVTDNFFKNGVVVMFSIMAPNNPSS